MSSFQNIQECMKGKDEDQYLNTIQRIQFPKWICQIDLVIGIDFNKKILWFNRFRRKFKLYFRRFNAHKIL